MRYFISILIINILVLGFYPQFSLAQTPQAPETLEEAKFVGLEILNQLPDAMKKVWREEAMPIWRGMWDKAQGPWNTWAKPKLESLWGGILNLLGKEVEKRKPALEEEFQKEKEEMQKEIQKSLWKKFKELLK